MRSGRCAVPSELPLVVRATRQGRGAAARWMLAEAQLQFATARARCVTARSFHFTNSHPTNCALDGVPTFVLERAGAQRAAPIAAPEVEESPPLARAWACRGRGPDVRAGMGVTAFLSGTPSPLGLRRAARRPEAARRVTQFHRGARRAPAASALLITRPRVSRSGARFECFLCRGHRYSSRGGLASRLACLCREIA